MARRSYRLAASAAMSRDNPSSGAPRKVSPPVSPEGQGQSSSSTSPDEGRGGGDAWVSDSSIGPASHLTELPDSNPSELPVAELAEEQEEATEVPAAGAVPAEPPDRQRGTTIARKQMLRERRRLLAKGSLPEIIEYDRPTARSQCRNSKRPCLYVACRYHLYLDVNPTTGSIKINFPDKDVHELEQSCALDVAEQGGVTLEEVGHIMNLTRERIRQVEATGLDKLRDGGQALDSFLEN